MDASLGTVSRRVHGLAPRRLIHACEGARRRRPPAVLRRSRRQATGGAHGRAAACSCRAHRERARHPLDRSQPLRPRRRARRSSPSGLVEAGDVRQRENLRAALLGAPATRARPFRCLSTRPSGVRRCSSVRSPTTRSSPPSSPIAARRSSITGSPVSTTKRWRGSDRNARRCVTCFVTPGAFAVFGPSVRVRAGRVVVPGGTDAEPLWQAIVGAEPARPAAFVRRLFGDESGHARLVLRRDRAPRRAAAAIRDECVAAWAGAHRARARAARGLRAHRQRVAAGEAAVQPAAVRSGVDARRHSGQRGWHAASAPDSAACGNACLRTTRGPRAAAPGRDSSDLDPTPIDAAWLLSRFHRVPIDVGRRRLDTFLFAQRVFPNVDAAGSAAHQRAARAWVLPGAHRSPWSVRA